MKTKTVEEVSEEAFLSFKEAVTRSKITYQSLEKITGIPKSNIQRYMSRKTKIPFDYFVKIAIAIGESPAELLGWCNEKLKLSPHEKALVEAYRAKPELQDGIDMLLGISKKELVHNTS